ncbi:hypothetical protein [Hufsiella ginkgonis]|uniref:Uncharacterized protein n=1 Tax=Hufsiella ginkgonis TaxID=2695274 RepID=A0A7K1XXJ8_9SPHI|nr:hypothetical protein [Hufsiella ginkgonis]MXV15720.1 hypothetical protein [Hufsiella ginkgonis]
MTLSDQEFREEFKPLQVPPSYDVSDTKENKVVFALADLGKGTADEVVSKITEFEPGFQDKGTMISTGDILQRLYEKGLLKGTEHEGAMVYNLSKITEANDGEVEPRLLAPGLD